MLDIKYIRNHPDLVDEALKRRGKEPISQKVLQLDLNHRQTHTDLQNLLTRRNQIAKEFGMAKKEGRDTSALSKESEELKEKIPHLEEASHKVDAELKNYLLEIPNLPATDCPEGLSEEENVEIRRFKEPQNFTFTPRQHFEIGENLNLLDFERAAKLSGSRFAVMYGALAKLERALAQFMLDSHTQKFGYEEVYVPLLVHDKAMYGTGQLPKFHHDQFQTTSGHWLIPTGEVPLTNLVADEILSEEELPLRYVAYTPCFRAEAGAAGKDTRGIIRQHQFSKVELVSITTPEQSVLEHERMTEAAESILKALDLPFRTLALCAGDMGFCAEKTYDLEVWLPGQKAYREISSCSRCNEFQARRMNARYRTKHDGKLAFVHTLNGSGIAVGRALVAVLENYQNEDGSVTVPDVLVPYLGGLTKITACKA